MNAEFRDQPHVASLRRLLLLWLLPGSLAIVVASGVLAYLISLGATRDAYDQGLLDAAREVEEQLVKAPHDFPEDLPPHAQRVLLVEPSDLVFFRLQSPEHGLRSGTAELPLPEAQTPDARNVVQFYDTQVGSHPVRAVAIRTEHEGKALSVAVAATLLKRDQLSRSFLIGMILPGSILMLAMLVLVRFGIRVGLTPLNEVRHQLALRSPSDLSAIEVDNPPREIKPLLDEINDLLKRLSDSLESQRHFVSDAAHQLRTPIAALQAQIESTIVESRSGDAERLQRILQAAQRLAHVVHQLLSLARTESGTQLPGQVFDVAELIRETALKWLPLAIDKGIDLGFELSPARIKGIPLLIEEMLGNLIDNAITYSPRHGRITVRCEEKAEEIVLQVEDNGPGIPKEQRERVFERFVRLSHGTADGCGLGLAVVRHIAHQHQGEVSIDDAPGGGTLVVARFPSALPEQNICVTG